MMVNFHGNNRKNSKHYHLYEIIDKKKDDIFKYGISGDKINPKDGLSKRVRDQVTMGNLFVGWLRYFGRIVVKDNAKARAVKDQYLKNYFKNNGEIKSLK